MKYTDEQENETFFNNAKYAIIDRALRALTSGYWSRETQEILEDLHLIMPDGTLTDNGKSIKERIADLMIAGS